jgi:ATP-dependent Clp protease ATP-binding subunit ClpA
MFERFTDRARRVVVMAQEEARMLDHNYIGTEHLLLGIAHEGNGVGAKALESLGINLDAVRQQTEGVIGRGEQAPSGHIPFTPRAKKVLELSLRESTQLGHRYIGTEHILLGLLREGQGVAAQVLAGLGVDLDQVRQQVIELLQARSEQVAATARQSARRAGPRPAEEGAAQLTSLDLRLDAIERWVGIPTAVDDLGKEIAEVRRDKEAAINAQDFERAAALRDEEKRLLLTRDNVARERAEGPSLTDEVRRLTVELEALHALLRAHGIEPGDDAA